MGKAICKELGKTSAIVLAGRNPAKLETAKAELDELGVESDLCKTDIADRAQVQALCCIAGQREADHPHLRCVAERYRDGKYHQNQRSWRSQYG